MDLAPSWLADQIGKPVSSMLDPLAPAAANAVMTPFAAPGFEPVLEAFQRNFADGLELGAGFCALVEGEVVVDVVGGFADRTKTKPWTQDTLVPVYSTTKPIATLVIARLQDQGVLSFDDPIGWLWPEFTAHGKDVSIAQALSHQAGVPGFKEPIDPALWLNPPALAAALAELEPMWAPGSANGYHPLTFGYIIGELAQRAHGTSLGTQLREQVCAPLGLDFWIGLPDEHHTRCAEIARPNAAPNLGPVNEARRAAFLTRWAAPDRGGADWRRTEIPSANGHGTARAVAHLYSVFANDGRIGKTQVISPETMKEVTKTRIKGDDLVLPYHLDWAAGVMRNSNLIYGNNPNTLGHSGWGGSGAFGDPDRRVSAAYVMNKQTTALLGDERAGRLWQALYACL
jgi:CubicO group peptidase (beta-lactamase class C family)